MKLALQIPILCPYPEVVIKLSARLSFGNSTTKGIIPNNKLNRQTIVLRTTSQITDFLSFDAKINYIHDEGDQQACSGFSYQTMLPEVCVLWEGMFQCPG